MKILSTKIEGFGKLRNTENIFGSRLNIIYGKNEAGKTTTHNFIKSMFFGMTKKKSRASLPTVLKYEPWIEKETYKGELVFSYKNNTYTIKRQFNADDERFIIIDNETKNQIKNPELFMSKILCNLTETSFDNTISIGQLKSATENGMVSELRKYISNLNTSGDMSINTIAAIEFLKQQKKQLINKQTKDATLSYTRLLGNIRNAEHELADDKYKNKIPDLNNKKNTNNLKIKNNAQIIENTQNEIDVSYNEFRSYGFDARQDIDTLKVETEKFIKEYYKLKNNVKRATKFALNIILIILSILLTIFNTMIMVVSYPQIGNSLNIYNVSSTFKQYTNLLSSFPFPIIYLNILFYAIALILFVSGLVMIITDTQSGGRLDEISEVLSSVFYQHIHTNVVNKSNIAEFQKHLVEMYNLIDEINDKKEKISNLSKKNDEMIEEQEVIMREIQEQQRIQYEIEKKIEKINNLKEEAEKLKKEIAQNDNIQKEIDSINLSIDMLNELSNKVKVMFGTYINDNASKYIDGITHGIYNSINVDNAFNITVNTKERIVPIEQLSSGTIDQMYLAIRLSIAKVINGTNEILPLIFDDCFALYDDDRLAQTLRWLPENYPGQIIIFTCHTREKDILTRQNQDFNLIEIV